jgi:transcriptional regulator with XRE-family HTH domain
MGGKKIMESEQLREILSLNIKKERKKLGLTQEKLAEFSDLSSQTINDIEGCRMWVSDKTIIKLARVLHVEAYQLLVPMEPITTQKIGVSNHSARLSDIIDRTSRDIEQLFKEATEAVKLTIAEKAENYKKHGI